MARGGKRQGTPGASYSNRSDLRAAQAPPAASGPQYGDKTALANQEAALPTAASQPQQSAAPAPPQVFAGDRGDFLRPSENPQQHVMSGAPVGPGPGTEAAPLMANPDELDVASMGKYLPALEIMASLPDASIASRAFVRKLRGSLPAQGQ